MKFLFSRLFLLESVHHEKTAFRLPVWGIVF